MQTHRKIGTLVASLALAAALATATTVAWAKPKTTLLDGLKSGLEARALTLDPEQPVDVARALVIRAALQNIKKDKSTSLDGDIGTLKKVAGKIELAYGVNDALLVASLDGFIARVQADLAPAEAGALAIFDPTTRAAVDGLLVTARSSLAATLSPPTDGNSVKLRATTLRTAARAVAAAASRIAKPELCVKGGGWFSTVGATAFAPEFTTGTFYGSSFTSPFTSFELNSYHYDRKNTADPYARGATYIRFDGAQFHGTGDYALGIGAEPAVLTYTVNGVSWTATSGTAHVTRWDPAKKELRGTVEATLTNFGGGEPTTMQLTGGRFRACRWHLAAVPQ
ncbi:MAG: hypothetical protein K8T90_02245 [Planctomycetes bacterium]|nr:hypothetical protein [Planctomycetota bacterium]